MKKVFYLFVIMVSMVLSSCLKSGLDDLPIYDEADITSVVAVKYRYISDEKSPASGDYLVKEVDLNFSPQIDAEEGFVKIDVSVPDNFPETEKEKVSKSNLVVIVNLSTAARIFPIGDSPALGTPGNWNEPNKYRVQSASGTDRQWTIEIGELMR